MTAIIVIVLGLIVWGGTMQLWEYYILGNRGTPVANKEAVLRELSRLGIITEEQYVRAARELRLNKNYMMLKEDFTPKDGGGSR